MKRTSLTHPLQFAVVTAGSEFGRLGITFCPGKHDRHAMSGEWGVGSRSRTRSRHDPRLGSGCGRYASGAQGANPVKRWNVSARKYCAGICCGSISQSLTCQFRESDLSRSGILPVKSCARSCAAGSTCWSTAAEGSDVLVR
jgi:hypothetical protein